MKKLLILGSSGLVGKSLIEEFKGDYDLYGTYFSSLPTYLHEGNKFHLDIQQIDQLKDILRSIEPDVVISCLRGEFTQQLEFHKQLALEIQNSNSRLCYFSTANIFDGDFSKHHTETDEPISQSDYGNFKITCENKLKQILNERVMIIRIPQIWGKNSPRLNKIKACIDNNEAIDVYSNLECNNLLDTVLAKQVRYIIEKELKGIFHLGSIDMVNQSEFVKEIINNITAKKINLHSHLLNETEDACYFGLKSNRNDIPDFLQCTNNDIIASLKE